MNTYRPFSGGQTPTPHKPSATSLGPRPAAVLKRTNPQSSPAPPPTAIPTVTLKSARSDCTSQVLLLSVLAAALRPGWPTGLPPSAANGRSQSARRVSLLQARSGLKRSHEQPDPHSPKSLGRLKVGAEPASLRMSPPLLHAV